MTFPVSVSSNLSWQQPTVVPVVFSRKTIAPWLPTPLPIRLVAGEPRLNYNEAVSLARQVFSLIVV